MEPLENRNKHWLRGWIEKSINRTLHFLLYSILIGKEIRLARSDLLFFFCNRYCSGSLRLIENISD